MSVMQQPRKRYLYALMSNTTNNQLGNFQGNLAALQNFIHATGSQYSACTLALAESAYMQGDWHAIKITPENINLKTQFLSAQERKDPLLKSRIN